MAFLDNSGDIILDAVLTDVGRMRMAQGDGSFKITKFALGDDEINYGLWNSAHGSGSAYYDLEIRQTPVLEAFSNNAASLKHKLISYTNPNLLYLPELILNTNVNKTYADKVAFFPYEPAKNAFVVAATRNTAIALGPATRGVIDPFNARKDSYIRLEFGLNADGKTPVSLRKEYSELNETQFIIECDSRFCTITDTNNRALRHAFHNESSIATFVVSSTVSRLNGNIVTEMTQFGSHLDRDQPDIKYARGNMLQFKVGVSSLLQNGLPSDSKSLWVKHGSAYNSTDWDTAAGSIVARCNASGEANNLDYRATQGDFFHIDTNIRVTAVNTGVSMDVPIVIVKSVNFTSSTC
jgi:hypothetical protein